jgi:hypothetical protein
MQLAVLLTVVACGRAADDVGSGREANLGVVGAHEHGVARLNIGVEDREAHIEVMVPGASVYGFEGAPRTAEQRQRLEEGLQRLSTGVASLVRFAPEAGCEPSDVRLLDGDGVARAWTQADGHDHSHDGHGHSHKAATAHADTDHADPVHDHAHDHTHDGDAHDEVQLTAVFRCQRPLAGTLLRVDVGRLLPDVTSVDLQIVSETRQFGARVPAVGYETRFEE